MKKIMGVFDEGFSWFAVAKKAGSIRITRLSACCPQKILCRFPQNKMLLPHIPISFPQNGIHSIGFRRTAPL